MAISAVEQEIRTVTGLKPKGKEERSAFLSRLAEGLQKISDDAWDNMTKGGQEWANLATKAYDNDKAVKEFADEEEEAEPDSESEAEAEEEAPPARGRKAPPKAAAKVTGKAGKAPPAAKPTKAAAKKAAKGNGERVLTGVKVDIKKMIIKNPEITAEEIMDGLRKHPPVDQPDYVPSKFTVASIGSEFRHSLRVLRQEGMIDLEI